MTVGPELFAVLDPIADAFNPALALLAISVPFVRPRWRGARVAAYFAALAVGLFVVYAIKWANAARVVDYSTHTAFAVSVGVSIAVARRTWRMSVAIAVVAYLVLAVIVGYHTLAGVVVSALGAAVTTLPAALRASRL